MDLRDLRWFAMVSLRVHRELKELRDQRLHVELISRANSADLDYYRIAPPGEDKPAPVSQRASDGPARVRGQGEALMVYARTSDAEFFPGSGNFPKFP